MELYVHILLASGSVQDSIMQTYIHPPDYNWKYLGKIQKKQKNKKNPQLPEDT